MSDTRLVLRDWLLEREGFPYLWGWKGPDAFDCSGFVTCGLLAMGCRDMRQTHNAGRLFAALKSTKEPMPLDLAFYGPPGSITHVMFFMANGDGRVFGACGGNAFTTTVEKAREQGACVRFRPKVDYRPDFRGFRRIPLP